MSYFRVTSGVSAVPIPDLGYTVPASSVVVLSNQFSINDLYLSADLEALIIASTLTVEINYGTGYQSILAADYTNRDALAAFMNIYEITNENNNEDLVDGSEASALHNHGNLYYTETELGATSGAGLIGADDTAWDPTITFTTVQEFIDDLAGLWTTIDLDFAYDNDADGVLNVDGVSKPLNLRSDGSNDIQIGRKVGADEQAALLFDVSADELLLGQLLQGGLNQIDVRVRTNLIVDGNVTFTGTITDTTVNELNVTNANIRLREDATAVPGTDAYIEVERGTSGNDARLLWNETTDRWQAGIVGAIRTLAWLEYNEVVTGVWEFQGAASTDPSFYLTDKAAAPSTQLGSASQIPWSSITNVPAYYDKTRTKWLSMFREYMTFAGRDNQNNANEYMRCSSEFTSNQSSARLMHNMTLIGISAQTNGAETWTARVRKNGSVTNLASLVLTAVDGDSDDTLNIDFNVDDKIEVFIDGSGVDRPLVRLEFAQRF